MNVFGKDVEKRTVMFIVVGFFATVIVSVFLYFYIEKKFTVIPGEITKEMMKEQMVQRQLDNIDTARERVREQFFSTKSAEEQLSAFPSYGRKPLTEKEVQKQLDAIDKLRYQD